MRIVDCGFENIDIPCRANELEELLWKEWLRANRLGAYSSSTIIGCNTRRYHGLLVGAATPPVARLMTLSTVMEQLVVGENTYDLATNEFRDTFSPRGFEYLETFRDDTAATFVYEVAGVKLTKQVLLAQNASAVAVRYELSDPQHSARLILRPFTAMRDFHSLRSVEEPHNMAWDKSADGIVVLDHAAAAPPVYISCTPADFRAEEQWWYRFLYRAEAARGQGCYEDLYSPGVFVVHSSSAGVSQLTASLGERVEVDFDKTLKHRRDKLTSLAAPVAHLGGGARRLAMAADAFIVTRPGRSGTGSSILAGFPWFADWGRDTFIALPGLLLTTGQFAQARQVFSTYAENISLGMIPNRFDDYGGEAHYNSIDASLWFIIAAERYMQAIEADAPPSDKRAKNFWPGVLLPACETILANYRAGTRFGIAADADGLLAGGSYQTQLTWMDAKCGDEVITGRYGKAVEVNALWHSAHRILAQRCEAADPAKAHRYADQAQQIARAFTLAFWNEPFGWLNDCVNDAGWDASLRPNQILAVSLPYSPLSAQQQKSVVDIVQEVLLTPMGLRSLAPLDPRYAGQYGPGWEARERAYHQGTVWAWLIGPFVEAYLKVADPARRAENVEQVTHWLGAFDEHLDQAGLGYISEIFDGDKPHTPRGCYAQAWSVAEVLRAKALLANYETG